MYDLIWDGERCVWLFAEATAWWPHGPQVRSMARRCFNMPPFYAVSKWGDATVGGSSDGSLFTAEGSEVRQFDVHKRRCWPSEPRTAASRLRRRPWACVPVGRRRWKVGHETRCPTPFGKIRHIAPHPEGLMLATGSGQVVVMAEDGKVVSAVQAHARAYWAGVHPTKPSR